MKKILLIFTIVFTLWFIPWAFVFHLGAIAYFPYKADGHSRFVRITGPLPESLGFNTGWSTQSEIPLQCAGALIVAEDGKFLEHAGIDIDSIKQAIESNKKRKIARGGSTITQQLVKNVFLYRNKTYFRKSREVVGALLLDLTMSKRKQITWYLNVVEFGPNLYGIKNASKYYFNKPVSRLSLSDCASLISVLRDPVKSSKGLKSHNMPGYLLRRKQSIMASVINSGILTQLKNSP